MRLQMSINLEDLVIVGFNKQVIALDRYSGNKVWEWKASNGAGFSEMFFSSCSGVILKP